ncbi:30S ribosomal protein S19e [archaeon SCG-AAA382B04]|nr:30S ribosomal protein S19e [archaeon SCG-AAA382B04]
MATAYDVPANKLIEETSERLLKEIDEIEMPEWAKFVKTAANKERAPTQQNWWYTRTAALLRKVYTKQPIGVERLRKYYGSKDKTGSSPERSEKGSGKIIRKGLQQLEEAGFVESTPEGRKITAEGKSFLDSIASELKSELEKEKEELKKY